MRVTVGLASGLGNCVYMLPAIKALNLLGHEITLYVQTDFPTSALWRRCAYAVGVIDSGGLPGDGPLVCGQWRPTDWIGKKVEQYRLARIHDCEWRSNMRIAQALGWKDEPPQVSDWCLNLDRKRVWDIGIVPGSKGGTWFRKRWWNMGEVATELVRRDRSIAVFGMEQDGVAEIPGQWIKTPDIAALPDALAGCGVVIGTDSGPTHLASSLGVPVVMVYTGTSEIKAEPVCRPNRKIIPEISCHPCVSTPRWQACREWKCQEISPVLVVQAAEELLGESR